MNPMKKNEMPFKQWLAERALELGLKPKQVWDRIYTTGTLTKPKLRRVNARVLFVVLKP